MHLPNLLRYQKPERSGDKAIYIQISLIRLPAWIRLVRMEAPRAFVSHSLTCLRTTAPLSLLKSYGMNPICIIRDTTLVPDHLCFVND